MQDVLTLSGPMIGYGPLLGLPIEHLLRASARCGRAILRKFLAVFESGKPAPAPIVGIDLFNDDEGRVDGLLEHILDPDRIRRFAAGKQTPELNAFMAQVAAGNLWRFARRPLDLEWLVDFWRENRRLGTLAEMQETNIRVRLWEPDPDRARQDPLDATRAMHALQRIGAALVFGRQAAIAIPDR